MRAGAPSRRTPWFGNAECRLPIGQPGQTKQCLPHRADSESLRIRGQSLHSPLLRPGQRTLDPPSSSVLAHCRDATMVPAPFYSELPADLGDDQTWVDQAAGCGFADHLMHPPSRGLCGAVSDRVVSGTARVRAWLRRVPVRYECRGTDLSTSIPIGPSPQRDPTVADSSPLGAIRGAVSKGGSPVPSMS